MAQNIGTGATGQVIADISSGLGVSFMHRMDNYIHLERNKKDLQEKLKRMKDLMNNIFEKIQNQQRAPLGSIPWERLINAIGEATQLISRSQGEQGLLDLLRFPPQVSEMNEKFDKLSEDLQTGFSLFRSVENIFSYSTLWDTALPLRHMSDVGLVGRAFESTKIQLQTWINAEDPQLRMIVVYGMPGVGKTTVLRESTTSSREGHIAGAIGLDLSSTPNTDSRAMKLSANLEKKKFLLIMDDIWSSLDLQELGMAFGSDKGSKVVFSTRNRGLVSSMGASAFTEMKQLSKEEGRELFDKVAFTRGHVPQQLKGYSEKVADECEGLPLAIVVVAAAMRDKNTVDLWDSWFSMMKNTDPSFPDTHSDVDQKLYRILRLSYDDLVQTPNLQSCFLYGAMYPEDEEIWVEELVRMWIAEGFFKNKEASYSMDMILGHRYVKLLIDRGLFQTVNFEKQSMDIIVNKPVKVWKKRFIRVHDDMAILIEEKNQNYLWQSLLRRRTQKVPKKNQNYLCRAGLELKKFPSSQTQPCKRMSLRRNQVKSLPEDFPCTQLVSLMLSENPLVSLPTSLTHLRVLDLSNTLIESVPTSLTHLRFLDLSNTLIESVPTSLTHLRVLDLSNTLIESVPTSLTQLEFLTMRHTRIKELPKDIGNLSNLQFLDISECKYLTSLPTEISQLTSLKILHLNMGMENGAVNDPTNVIALTGLKNLEELHLFMFFKFEKHEIMGTIFGSWVKMRHLYLHYNHMNPMKCNLPEGMQNMKKLESLVLFDYRGTHLPNWICEFQQLKRLELDFCDNVKELPPLERLSNLKFLKLRRYFNVRDLGLGRFEMPSRFPELEMLHLSEMSKLRSIGVFNEETLPKKLCVLKIKKCPLLRKLPMGMEKLPDLKSIHGHRISWWEKIIWEDQNMKMRLQNLFKEI